jgi:hypothetical protein
MRRRQHGVAIGGTRERVVSRERKERKRKMREEETWVGLDPTRLGRNGPMHYAWSS